MPTDGAPAPPPPVAPSAAAAAAASVVGPPDPVAPCAGDDSASVVSRRRRLRDRFTRRSRSRSISTTIRTSSPQNEIHPPAAAPSPAAVPSPPRSPSAAPSNSRVEPGRHATPVAPTSPAAAADTMPARAEQGSLEQHTPPQPRPVDSLLRPFQTYMLERRQAQDNLIVAFALACGIVAFLSAHIAQRFTSFGFVSGIVSIAAAVYNLIARMGRQDRDDMWLVEQHLISNLRARGWKEGQIMALLSGETVQPHVSGGASPQRASPGASAGMASKVRRVLGGDAGGPAESVEWVNSLLSTVWPLISPMYFAPFIDLLEDALMQQVPGIVSHARVMELDQGRVPLKLRSIRLLPAGQRFFLKGTEESPDWNTSPKPAAAEAPIDPATSFNETDEWEDLGDFINLEVSFSYRAASTISDRKNKKSNKVKDKVENKIHEHEASEQRANLEKDPSSAGHAATSAKRYTFLRSLLHRHGVSNREDMEFSEDRDSEAYDASAFGDEPTYQKGRDMIHMLMYFHVGIKKLADAALPVWLEVLGIEGTMRVRVQMTPVLPFIKHIAFTFAGEPKLELGAKPLGERMVIDAMQLPLISTYVLKSIEQVITGFIAPKSYVMDLHSLLSVGEGPQTSYAVGAIALVIHEATSLPAADANGEADPFVVAAFSREMRPLFSTRVVLSTRNPVWQEFGVILVTPDDLEADQSLRILVNDADRFSADDQLGQVSFPLARLRARAIKRAIAAARSGVGVKQALTMTAGTFETRTLPLQPVDVDTPTQGAIKLSLAWIPLEPGLYSQVKSIDDELKREREHKDKQAERKRAREAQIQRIEHLRAMGREHLPSLHWPSSGAEVDSLSLSADTHIDGSVDEKEEQPDLADEYDQFLTGFDRFVNMLGMPLDEDTLKARKDRADRIRKLTSLITGEQDQADAPPRDSWPAGVLSYHVHMVDRLEPFRQDKTLSGRSKRAGATQGFRQAAAQSGIVANAVPLPSPYAYIVVDDEPVLRTRTSPLNPQPFWNAGSERFIGDWRTCRVDVVIKDERNHEADAVLGMVSLRVRDVLKKSARHTGWYTLTSGMGYGRVKVSLVFTPLAIAVPPSLAGWNIGTVEVIRARVLVRDDAPMTERKIGVIVSTFGAKESLAPRERDRFGMSPLEAFPNGEGGASHAADTLRLTQFTWAGENCGLRLALRQRYPGFVRFALVSERKGLSRRTRFGHALVRLNQLPDSGIVTLRVPIVEGQEGEAMDQTLVRLSSHPDELLSMQDRLKSAAAASEAQSKRTMASSSNRSSPQSGQTPLPPRQGAAPAVPQVHAGDATAATSPVGASTSASTARVQQSPNLLRAFAEPRDDAVAQLSSAVAAQRGEPNAVSETVAATVAATIGKQEHHHRHHRSSSTTSTSPSTSAERKVDDQVGTLEVTLVFWPGVSPEHRGLAMHDDEMRIAYETFLTATDAQERAPPGRYVPSQEAEQQPAELQPPPVPPKDQGQNQAPVQGLGKAQTRGAGAKDEGDSLDLDAYDSYDEDEDENENASVIDGAVGPDAQERSRDLSRRAVMHRQQRGAAQLKAFRTARWLSRGVVEKAHHVKYAATRDRQFNSTGVGHHLEHEGVSHL